MPSTLAQPHSGRGPDETLPPRLPWATVPGPLRWVDRMVWISIAVCVLPLLVGFPPGSLAFTGLGIGSLTAALTYEGLRTGTVRMQGPQVAFVDSPNLFWFVVLMHIVMTGVGIRVFISALW